MAEDGYQPPPERNWKMPLSIFFKDARLVFKMDALGLEILQIAFPAALALAADPIASLIDTAFIGSLGPVELAAVGVSIAIFHQASKVTILPLVSITTSFVAEEETVGRISNELLKVENLEKGSPKSIEMEELKHLMAEEDFETTVYNSSIVTSSNPNKAKFESKKRHIPSASTALVVASVLGLLQTIFLISLAKPILGFMGVKSGSPMLTPALRYLTLRSLGAPAVLLSLAMQGVFRGFKDTKSPLYATVAGDVLNIILDPILIFSCHLGISGAAIAHVLSQYLMSIILLCQLMKKVDLLPPSIKDLQFSRFLKKGFLLLVRVIAVTFCVTLAASKAARLGPTPMAAFQICLQVWMTSSLLADGLAVAGQAILACAFAEKDYAKATAAASRVLQMGFVLGLGLAVVVGLGLQFGSGIFSKDKDVLYFISIGVPFVAATQPINSIAFVFDGVNFGASDFAYSAFSMVTVAIVSIASLLLLTKSYGFVGIWFALTIYMVLRMFAGIWRMGTGTGPWRFLRGRLFSTLVSVS
ncbi:protein DETOXIFICATION 43-like [Cornus florida]|uniref:protein DETOXIFICATION 43-like n=1 Tax=Cornus florida TaxID=4283 RepID=UPI0028989526|nr:protein DETOXIFICATION 43-like [Cornus florida]XP_059651846.1 protein DETOXIFICATION 43-like [Cornus florida]XP_059651847.1 protein DETOXIFICATION 43-like [Cornus florida]XP_059651848.1 protein DETOXIFICATION 43-like [Cornus florida]XP_059651849.1 protein DETOXIFICATION 43-like [Cornus florida]XP_059651850.1 protein DETOXIFICATION 43-like [Cornus florida]